VFFPKDASKDLIQQLVYFGVEKHDDLVDAFTIVLHKAIEEDRPPVRVYPYNIYEAIRGGGSSYYSDRRIF